MSFKTLTLDQLLLRNPVLEVISGEKTVFFHLN